HQLGRGFLADAAHAGDVVGWIAFQGFQIHNERGGYAEFFPNAILVVHHDVAHATAGRVHAHIAVHELERVHIAGDDGGGDVLRRCLPGEGADHVVGLVPVRLVDRDIEHA